MIPVKNVKYLRTTKYSVHIVNKLHIHLFLKQTFLFKGHVI